MFIAAADDLEEEVGGVAKARETLTSWVECRGLEVLGEVLRADAERIAGAKDKRRRKRTANHWGTRAAEVPFAGRHITVQRPRVRSTAGQEVPLPSLEAFRQHDALDERTIEQLVLGVSTRGYAASLEPLPSRVRGRGARIWSGRWTGWTWWPYTSTA